MMKNTWSMVMMTHINVDDNVDDDDDDDNEYDNNPWSPGAPWEKPSESENDSTLVFLNNLDNNILEKL